MKPEQEQNDRAGEDQQSLQGRKDTKSANDTCLIREGFHLQTLATSAQMQMLVSNY
jgi:hypothetical protein